VNARFKDSKFRLTSCARDTHKITRTWTDQGCWNCGRNNLQPVRQEKTSVMRDEIAKYIARAGKPSLKGAPTTLATNQLTLTRISTFTVDLDRVEMN